MARRALAGLLAVAALYGVVRAVTDAGDLDGFHAAARELLDTRRFSTLSAVERYPPVFQVLMLPLAVLPLGAAAVVALGLATWALCRLPLELERLGAGAWSRQWPAWVVAAPVLVDNLMLAQWAPLLLLLTLRGVRLARDGRGAAAGALFGLALMLKPVVLPLLAAPLLLGWRGPGGVARQAALGLGLAGALAAGVLAMLLWAGAAESEAATRDWWTRVRAGHTPRALVEQGRSLRHNNQALGIVLARDFSSEPMPRARGRVQLVGLPPETVWAAYHLLLSVLAVAGLAAALRLARGERRRDERGLRHPVPRHPDAWLRVTALAALGLLFVSPIVWTHYFAWMLPALACLGHRRRGLLLGGIGFALALASEPLRALGVHMLAAVWLYALVAWEAFAVPTGAGTPDGNSSANRAVR